MKILMWDWKAQPDFDELARLVTEVTGVPVKIRKVETGTDQYAIAILPGGDALESGDVVAVLTHNGEVGYYGEVVSVPEAGSDAALYDRGRYGIYNPDTDDTQYVAAADGEGIRAATEAETDDYIERWGIDSEFKRNE